MCLCKKCKQKEAETNHYIIPKAIMHSRKYQIHPTVSNRMEICKECHEIIHHRFSPYKYWWKWLETKTLKMKNVNRLNNLIIEMRIMQLEL
jgi:hypothetical protein